MDMTRFAAAQDRLVNRFGVAAAMTPAGAAPEDAPVEVTIVMGAWTARHDAAGADIAAERALIELRQAPEIERPEPGTLFDVAGVIWVQAEPAESDAGGLVWRLECLPQPFLADEAVEVSWS